MKEIMPWLSFSDQSWQKRDRSLQKDNAADRLGQVMNADAAVVAEGTFYAE